jgi:hypothetical protein
LQFFFEIFTYEVVKYILKSDTQKVFESVNRLNTMNNRKQDRHRGTKLDKRSLLAAATTAFGNIKDWQLEDLKSARSLVTMLKPKDLRELDTSVVSSTTSFGRNFHANLSEFQSFFIPYR